MKHECKNLVKLSSMNKKICPDCGKEYECNLEPDQKPLLNSSRGDRSNHELIDKFNEERVDIIWQNWNDGTCMKKIVIDVVASLCFIIFWIVFVMYIFETIDFEMYPFSKLALASCLIVLIPFGIQFFRVGTRYFYWKYIYRGPYK